MNKMLKLGKVITQSTTSVYIFAFNFNEMSWSKTPSTVDFSLDKEPFGTGGFRQAFKAKSNDKEFQGTCNHCQKSLAHTPPFPHSMLESTICPNSLRIGAFTVCKQH